MTRLESIHPVVGRFLGDNHVMHMAFPHTGSADLDKPGLAPQFLNRAAAHIAHTGLESAHKLENDLRQQACIGNAPP